MIDQGGAAEPGQLGILFQRDDAARQQSRAPPPRSRPRRRRPAQCPSAAPRRPAAAAPRPSAPSDSARRAERQILVDIGNAAQPAAARTARAGGAERRRAPDRRAPCWGAAGSRSCSGGLRRERRGGIAHRVLASQAVAQRAGAALYRSAGSTTMNAVGDRPSGEPTGGPDRTPHEPAAAPAAERPAAPPRSPRARMAPLRRDFGQRGQHEAALVQSRVRQHEAFADALRPVVVEQVEIERAGGIRRAAAAPEPRLRAQAARQQRRRRERRSRPRRRR